MIFFRNLFTICFFLIICSCSSKPEEVEDDIIRLEDGTFLCSNTEVSITEGDNIVIESETNPVRWTGTYSENSIKINYTKSVGTDGESETYTFIFDKTDDCPEIERAYKFYDGSDDDISAVTEMQVLEFYVKQWKVDQLFSGLIYYKDPHTKEFVSIKFWVDFTEENFEAENTNYYFFSDCFGNKLPINIDINEDGVTDYKMISEETRDIGNTPQFNIYTIKLESTNQSENQILSPKNNQAPYSVIFEAPFTSENKKQYLNGAKSALDVFYEFDAPYQNFNYFLDNNLTNKKVLENNKVDYYIISMNLNDKIFYGWIKFEYSTENCNIEILETYLNPVSEEHISVSN